MNPTPLIAVGLFSWPFYSCVTGSFISEARDKNKISDWFGVVLWGLAALGGMALIVAGIIISVVT